MTVENHEISRVGHGILTLLGIAKGDSEVMLGKLITKICELRIFEDHQGKMNETLKDVGGSHLIVSQFTLLGDCSAGRRPSFMDAENPKRAKQLYELALSLSAEQGIPTAGGIFQADMKVALINDGPVTFVLEMN